MFSPYEDAPTVMKGTLRSNPETKVVVILKDEVNPEATVSTNMNCGGKLTRDCSGDGVTGDGGYGDITGDKIFTCDQIMRSLDLSTCRLNIFLFSS